MENNILEELIGEIELLGQDICDEIVNIYEKNKENAVPSGDSYRNTNDIPAEGGSMQLQFTGSGIFEHVQPAIQMVIDHATKLWYNHVLAVIESHVGKGTEIDQHFLQCTLAGSPPWESTAEIQAIIQPVNSKHYTWHVDQPLIPDIRHNPNRRFLSLIVYLTDVEDGGETEFWFGKKFKAEKGKVIIFPSVFPFIHKGTIPISADKYILQIFLNHTSPEYLLRESLEMMRGKVIELEYKLSHYDYSNNPL